MRKLILALPFTFLPLSLAYADDHDHDHGSLDKHEHGISALNVALEGNKLEIELESPAMNIVGFEHTANSDADKSKVTAAQAALEKPLTLFSLAPAAGCVVQETDVESPLFGNDDHDDHDEHDEMHVDAKGDSHSDIDADYEFTCSKPEALTTLNLAPFFKQFPGTSKVQVQLIAPSGQKGAELTPASPAMNF